MGRPLVFSHTRVSEQEQSCPKIVSLASPATAVAGRAGRRAADDQAPAGPVESPRDAAARSATGRRDGQKRDGGREYSRPRRDDRDRDRNESRTDSQARYDGPPIPEEITGRELDRSVQAQLKSLPDKLGLRVARHLVAAGLLIESEPEDGLRAHPGRTCPGQPARRGARGRGRGGVRRR